MYVRSEPLYDIFVAMRGRQSHSCIMLRGSRCHQQRSCICEAYALGPKTFFQGQSQCIGALPDVCGARNITPAGATYEKQSYIRFQVSGEEGGDLVTHIYSDGCSSENADLEGLRPKKRYWRGRERYVDGTLGRRRASPADLQVGPRVIDLGLKERKAKYLLDSQELSKWRTVARIRSRFLLGGVDENKRAVEAETLVGKLDCLDLNGPQGLDGVQK